MENMRKTIFGRLDTLTLFLYFALVCVGLLAIFSVEHRSTDTVLFDMSKSYTRQFIWLGVSLFVGFLIILTESRFFSSIAYLSYTIGIFLLIITIFAGVNVKGSHSWLGAGSVRFQPGEVCKIFTSLAMAKFLSSPETNFKTLKHRIVGICLALVPAIIIIAQQETGLALVYFCFFLVMYREGLPNIFLVVGVSVIGLTMATLLLNKWWLFGIVTAIAITVAVLMRFTLKRDIVAAISLVSIWLAAVLFSIVLVPFAFKNVLQKHQVDRIYSTIGQDVPEEYMKDLKPGEKIVRRENASEYNVNQSKIAIGSGGLWGKGFLNGTSTKNKFVPEQHTDFIFCSIGEQFGFMGSLVLIGLYLSLMLRLIFLAERQRSHFSRIYGYCVAAILFFHFAINVSMTIGLAPVIGITLPLLSYGGSSLLSFSILIFIMIRLDSDRQVLIR
jgi:rod shape determining protein RodA